MNTMHTVLTVILKFNYSAMILPLILAEIAKSWNMQFYYLAICTEIPKSAESLQSKYIC